MQRKNKNAPSIDQDSGACGTNTAVVVDGDDNQVSIYNRDADDKAINQRLLELLDVKEADLETSNRLIADLQASIVQLESIAIGHDKLAQQAQLLLTQIDEGASSIALIPQIEVLIAQYEDSHVQQLVDLQLGRAALAFGHDTQKAHDAYLRVTQLDPANLDGWNGLGIMQERTGDLESAINSFQKLQAIGVKNK